MFTRTINSIFASTLIFFSSTVYCHYIFDITWWCKKMFLPFAFFYSAINGQFLSKEYRVDQNLYPNCIGGTKDGFAYLSTDQHYPDSTEMDNIDVALCFNSGCIDMTDLEEKSMRLHSTFPGENCYFPIDLNFKVDVELCYGSLSGSGHDEIAPKANNDAVCYRVPFKVAKKYVEVHNRECGKKRNKRAMNLKLNIDKEKWGEIHIDNSKNYEEKKFLPECTNHDHESVQKYRDEL